MRTVRVTRAPATPMHPSHPTPPWHPTHPYLVTCTAPVPSAFMTHTSFRPDRSLWKAIRFPSGNQDGVSSRYGVLCGLRRVAAPDFTSMTQMWAVFSVGACRLYRPD